MGQDCWSEIKSGQYMTLEKLLMQSSVIPYKDNAAHIYWYIIHII